MTFKAYKASTLTLEERPFNCVCYDNLGTVSDIMINFYKTLCIIQYMII